MSGWFDRWFGDGCPPWTWPLATFAFACIVVVVTMMWHAREHVIPGTTSGKITILGSPSGTTIIVRPIPKEPDDNCPSGYPIEMDHDGKRWCAERSID